MKKKDCIENFSGLTIVQGNTLTCLGTAQNNFDDPRLKYELKKQNENLLEEVQLAELIKKQRYNFGVSAISQLKRINGD